jgi:hypothetical protein
MTYSPIDFKYLEARADRESLREFIGKEAGPDPVSQLDLIRHLAPSILIADGYDFNELRELYAPMGLCCEHVSSAWSGDYRDDSLRCIAVRPFKPGGYDSHPYEFVQRLAGHLRDLLVRAETTPDFGNIIRHAYIEPESMDRWKEAAERWRLTQGATQDVDEAQMPDAALAELAAREADAAEFVRHMLDDKAVADPTKPERPTKTSRMGLDAGIGNKRPAWLDVTGNYIAGIMKDGQIVSAKVLYRELEAKAGPESPFDKGTGQNRGSLYVREIAAPVSLKTMQNNWSEIRSLPR